MKIAFSAPPRTRPLTRELARGAVSFKPTSTRHDRSCLCAPLETEDYVVQSMPDASPAKWHLAHTSWFFETFVVKPGGNGRSAQSCEYSYLFNSYYNSLGERIPRARRGLLSRPTVAEVYRYRSEVNDHVEALIESAGRSGICAWSRRSWSWDFITSSSTRS